ncbi:MAG TPA: FHA domain-containing protein [Anaerolineales bacterium]|jgi:pSer/pThr/pTyr-binding forkhead associated (FHA) protein
MEANAEGMMDNAPGPPIEPESQLEGNLEIKPDDDITTIPEEAFLIIDSVKVFPLTESVINIGRRLGNTLVIDDNRVSRAHAQLRAINGRYVLFDLDSSGGTFINGRKTTQAIVYPGDVISLAGVDLIYGQKNPPPRQDLKPTWPLE